MLRTCRLPILIVFGVGMLAVPIVPIAIGSVKSNVVLRNVKSVGQSNFIDSIFSQSLQLYYLVCRQILFLRFHKSDL